jgi:hypothetical protein
MLKLIKNVRTERLEDVIKCPNCQRTLGGIHYINGCAKFTILCRKCGHVSVEIEEYK